MLSFQGVPLHDDDREAVLQGRHYFAVKEVRGAKETIRLKRLRPRNVRGQVQLLGLLGAFGGGKDCTVRTSLGAVEVVSTAGVLSLHEYPLQKMVEEAVEAEHALLSVSGGGLAH